MAASAKVINIIRKSGVPPIETQFKLYNSICRSTLLYAAPIWAMKHREKLDKPQLYFLKKILRLPPTAPDYFVRLETGCRDTRLQFLSDTLGFWERICKKPDTSPAKQCLILQMKWLQSNTTPMQNRFCWASDFIQLLTDAKSQQIPDSCSPLSTYKKSTLTNYELELKNADVSRMIQSSFIPHYKSIKTKTTTESYFQENNNTQKSSLIAQLRLNKFSIKIGRYYIPLQPKCLLCSKSNSVEHLMFECRLLNLERQSLILQFLPNPAASETTPYDLYKCLFSLPYSDKIINNLFLFWIKVANYYDLCSE